jgi:short-subunit dehydrogenase
VTGASSGIGRSLAGLLSDEGAKVAMVSRSEDKLNELAAELNQKKNGELLVLPGDLTNEAFRRQVLDRVVEQWGGLDILINNAGLASWAHFADSTEEVMREIMEINFFAPIELIRNAIPILTDGNQPAVLNVASKCGRRGLPAWPEYSASKFALCGMTEAFRGELARFDMDVLLVLPGLTKTDLSKKMLLNQGKADIDFESGMPPETVAAGIINALKNNRTETVIGRDAKWLLSVNRFFPRLVDRLIRRKVTKIYQTSH